MRVTYYSRKRKGNKKTWYYRIIDDEGDRTSGINTHCSSKRAAQDFVNAQITKKGPAFWKQKQTKHQTFSEYAKDWWIYERCPYVRGKLKRNKQISRSLCDIRQGYLKRHIIPVFGKRRISSIKPIEVERWLLNLPEISGRYGRKLSAITCNQILSTFRIMCRYGVNKGILDNDPTKGIEALGEDRFEKGILEPDEIRTLFDIAQIEEIWLGDEFHYTINLLACSTGLRMGELQGLQRQYVFDGHIKVEHSWARKYGLKEPKTKMSRRFVPVPSGTFAQLERLIEFSPFREPEDLVFHGERRNIPITHHWIERKLYAAMRRIGISEEDRRARRVTFHSHRHWYNTLLRGKIHDAKLRALTGHGGEVIQNHYTHFRPEDFKDVEKICQDFFKETEG